MTHKPAETYELHSEYVCVSFKRCKKEGIVSTQWLNSIIRELVVQYLLYPLGTLYLYDAITEQQILTAVLITLEKVYEARSVQNLRI